MPSIKNVQPPKIIRDSGTHHPINQIKDFILFKLTQMGFQEVYGPEIESEEYNFDMLNIKKTHPARQMHDTFYTNEKSAVLRTHTSPVQIRKLNIFTDIHSFDLMKHR